MQSNMATPKLTFSLLNLLFEADYNQDFTLSNYIDFINQELKSLFRVPITTPTFTQIKQKLSTKLTKLQIPSRIELSTTQSLSLPQANFDEAECYIRNIKAKILIRNTRIQVKMVDNSSEIIIEKSECLFDCRNLRLYYSPKEYAIFESYYAFVYIVNELFKSGAIIRILVHTNCIPKEAKALGKGAIVNIKGKPKPYFISINECTITISRILSKQIAQFIVPKEDFYLGEMKNLQFNSQQEEVLLHPSRGKQRLIKFDCTENYEKFRCSLSLEMHRLDPKERPNIEDKLISKEITENLLQSSDRIAQNENEKIIKVFELSQGKKEALFYVNQKDHYIVIYYNSQLEVKIPFDEINSVKIPYFKNHQITIRWGKKKMKFEFPTIKEIMWFYSMYNLLYNPQLITKGTDASMNTLNLKVYSLTFNVGGEKLGSPISALFYKAEGSDMIILNFQEVPQYYISIMMDELSLFLKQREYALIESVNMWQMCLALYIKIPLIKHITSVQTHKKATGFANIIGNKGGLSLAFRYFDKKIAIIGCHLINAPGKSQERNTMLSNLFYSLRFGSDIDPQFSADFLIFLGDTNYRSNSTFSAIISEARASNHEFILKLDELGNERAHFKILYNFVEAPITFKPTYRRIRNEDEFSNKNEQAPSYTDRILLYSKAGVSTKITEYNSLNNFMGSDHRPVYQRCELQLVSPYIVDISEWKCLAPLEMRFQKVKFFLDSEDFESGDQVFMIEKYHSQYFEPMQKSLPHSVKLKKGTMIELPTQILKIPINDPRFIKRQSIIVSLHTTKTIGLEMKLFGECELVLSTFELNKTMSVGSEVSVLSKKIGALFTSLIIKCE